MGDIWMAGKLEVKPIGGVALAAPPTRVCAVMLVLLAERYPGWVSRRELGDALHSESPLSKRNTAVRQTLARLKRWLPKDSVVIERDSIRLARPWRILTGGSTGLGIAPGIEHPWMDEFRRRHTPEAVVEELSPEGLLFQTVTEVAKTDRDAARSILCAAPEIALLLPARDFVWAVGATRPSSRHEPNAIEHDMLIAWASYLAADVSEALRLYLRAYSNAAKRHDIPNMAKASAQAMFALLEMGDLDSAAEWLERLTKADREQSMHLLVLNAKAAFFWNNHLISEGLATLRSADRYAKVASRVEQLHYFSNLAVLEAEAGDVTEAMNSIERARALIAGPWDRIFQWNLAIAEAVVLSLKGLAPQADEILVQAISESSHPETSISSWYLIETQAETSARSGNSLRAQTLWRSVESERYARGLALTPRLLAKKQRIFTEGR
ncbi:MAG: tetratricopeptide repeat protein [Chthonomonas sp.]|nr:tetratricopeptide repeat protein [Chthonomonas sp.]